MAPFVVVIAIILIRNRNGVVVQFRYLKLQMQIFVCHLSPRAHTYTCCVYVPDDCDFEQTNKKRRKMLKFPSAQHSINGNALDVRFPRLEFKFSCLFSDSSVGFCF